MRKLYFSRFLKEKFKIGRYGGYQDSSVRFERVGSGRASRFFGTPLLPTVIFIPIFCQTPLSNQITDGARGGGEEEEIPAVKATAQD